MTGEVIASSRRAKHCPGWLIVDACLYIAEKVDQEDVVTLNRFHRRRTWPRSVRSILPHGDANTVKGILQWIQGSSITVNRVQIYNSLCSVIIILPPLVIPHLLARGVFSESFFHIDRARESLNSYQSSFSRKEEDQATAELVDDCRMLIDAIDTLVMHLVDEIERRLFHLQTPAELLAGYQNIHLVTRRASRLIRQRQFERRSQLHQQPLHVFSNQVHEVDSKLQLLIRKLHLDCGETGIFDSTDEMHVDLSPHFERSAVVPSAAHQRPIGYEARTFY
jgi:hypothetical protein